MKLSLSALLLAAFAVATPAQAQTAATTASGASASASATAPAPKKAVKKKAAAKQEAKPEDPEAKEPDVAGTTVSEYSCELGNKLTIFQNNDDSDHIALKWGKRLHRMTRVPTSTGAARYENHYYGLLWIGLPAKGILLDSKSGHELANECKTAEQLAQ
ncbi:MAG: hypothetical protein JO269_10855 [Burkholderiaceae bacterium]|nr:hypothetical protein [Burkholderiaceae bacterium]